MDFISRQDAREYINSKITELPKARKKGYVCPLCQNGTGEDGDGITSKDGKHYHCFKCGFSGDYLDFLKEQNNTDENGIFEMYGVTIRGDWMQQWTAPKQQTKPTAEQETDYTDYFLQAEEQILSSREAQDYLHGRGLTDETIQKYHIGYDAAWMSPAAIKNGSTVYPSKRIIIPTGNSSYIARAINDDVPKRYQKMKEGSSKIYQLEQLYDDENEPVFIVEGEIDALSILQSGYKAIGLGSLSNIPQLLKEIERRAPEKPIVISLDNDDDPDPEKRKMKRENIEKQNNKIQMALNAVGVKSVVSSVSGLFKDANEYLQNDPDGFRKELERNYNRMRKPHNVSDYLFTGFLSDVLKNETAQKPKTGFKMIDDGLNGGLYPGLYVIGAIPSIGKTTFVLQMADNLAADENDVIFFSLEQSRFELTSKSLSRMIFESEYDRTGNGNNFDVTSISIRQGKYKNQVMDAAEKYSKKIGNRMSIVSGNFSVNISYIKKYVSAYMERNNTQPVVIIDYLQVLQPEKDENGKNIRFFGTKDFTEYNLTELKKFSAEKEIPIIVISALNRENYILPLDFKSFRETSGIEYTADFVGGLQYQVLTQEQIFTDEKGTAEKRKKLSQEKQKYPRKIEFVCLKNRPGNLFTCGFEYYTRGDCFRQDENYDYGDDVRNLTHGTGKKRKADF